MLHVSSSSSGPISEFGCAGVILPTTVWEVGPTAQSLLALEALSPPGGCLRNPEAEGRGRGVAVVCVELIKFV